MAGLPLLLRAAVSGTSAQPNAPQPGGQITLLDGATTLATLVSDATGAVSYTANLAVGQHTLLASYAGDRDDAPSGSSPVAVEIDRATTATALSATPGPVAFGSAVTLTAKVAGNGGIPGGTLTFLDGAAVLSAMPADAVGSATLTLTTLAPGIHALTATYSGDANDQPSQSPAVSVQVALHTALTVSPSTNPALLGDAVTLTLAAGNGTGTPPTGALQVTDNGSPLGPVSLVNGSATVTLTAPALGTHTLLASYAGDNNNGPASAQPLLLTVTLRPSATSLLASASALAAGQQLILISVVQAAGGHAATGSVQFLAGGTSSGTVLGTVPLSAAGVATLTLTPPTGSLGITAEYLGDSLYARSTSPALAVAVGPPDAFTLTATPGSLTLSSGQHAEVKLALASNPNFHETLAFGCAGLPAYATCTFSSDRVAVTPGLPQTLTVTVDTGNPLGAGTAAALPLGALLGLVFRRKRRWMRGLVLLAMVAMMGLASTGCATQFAQSTTPPGSYGFQVVGTGVTTGVTQTAAVQLTVTK